MTNSKIVTDSAVIAAEASGPTEATEYAKGESAVTMACDALILANYKRGASAAKTVSVNFAGYVFPMVSWVNEKANLAGKVVPFEMKALRDHILDAGKAIKAPKTLTKEQKTDWDRKQRAVRQSMNNHATAAGWLVYLHTTGMVPLSLWGGDGFPLPVSLDDITPENFLDENEKVFRDYKIHCRNNRAFPTQGGTDGKTRIPNENGQWFEITIGDVADIVKAQGLSPTKAAQTVDPSPENAFEAALETIEKGLEKAKAETLETHVAEFVKQTPDVVVNSMLDQDAFENACAIVLDWSGRITVKQARSNLVALGNIREAIDMALDAAVTNEAPKPQAKATGKAKLIKAA